MIIPPVKRAGKFRNRTFCLYTFVENLDGPDLLEFDTWIIQSITKTTTTKQKKTHPYLRHSQRIFEGKNSLLPWCNTWQPSFLVNLNHPPLGPVVGSDSSPCDPPGPNTRAGTEKHPLTIWQWKKVRLHASHCNVYILNLYIIYILWLWFIMYV